MNKEKYVRCFKCQGRKKYSALGHIERTCEVCEGIGYRDITKDFALRGQTVYSKDEIQAKQDISDSEDAKRKEQIRASRSANLARARAVKKERQEQVLNNS